MRVWRWITAALVVLFALAALRMSWLGDDAFITFRSVENMVLGNGPRWNVADRVQTYTHPLWFLLLCLARALTGELPTTAQVLGLVVSAITMRWLAVRLGLGHAAAAALLLCLASRACHVYATSGLETSLTQLLLVALVAAAATTDPLQRLRRVAFVTALLGTNRFDLLLLGAPLLAASTRGIPFTVAVRTTALGLAPLFAWSAFAIVYYGTPFPITAYAKALCHGVPAGDLAMQGLRYVWRSVVADPVTPTVIAAGIGLGLVRPGRRALAIGVALYTAYVVKVGGDYMQGRFLVPSFFASVLIVGTWLTERTPRFAAIVMFAALALTCVPGVPRVARFDWQPDPTYGAGADDILEEEVRGQWDHGLLSPGRVTRAEATFGSYGEKLVADGLQSRLVHIWGSVGWAGFRAGTYVHYVDPWLCDPLLARLPLAEPGRWRIGHFYRRVPAGYLESLATGENRITHPGLARFWNALRSAVRDPVWSGERWRNLWALWTGSFGEDVADFVATQYRNPPRIVVPLADLSAPTPASNFWSEALTARSAQTGGLEITLPEPTVAREVRLHVTPGFYEVSLRRAGAEVAHSKIFTTHAHDRLLANSVPIDAATGAIDAVWVDAVVPLEPPYTAIVGRVEIVK